jgi:hypothetical protein
VIALGIVETLRYTRSSKIEFDQSDPATLQSSSTPWTPKSTRPTLSRNKAAQVLARESTTQFISANSSLPHHIQPHACPTSRRVSSSIALSSLLLTQFYILQLLSAKAHRHCCDVCQPNSESSPLRAFAPIWERQQTPRWINANPATRQ